jgi:hypothetical protein
MSFFYFSTLGAIYFYILASVCAYAIWRGGKEYRLYSYCVLGTYLAARTLLATVSDEAFMITMGAMAEFTAVMALIAFAERTKVAGAMGFLFLAKMICYVGLLCGILSFAAMASWTELFGYIQIAAVGIGCSHGGGRIKRPGYPDHSAGRAGIFSLTKSWLSHR